MCLHKCWLMYKKVINTLNKLAFLPILLLHYYRQSKEIMSYNLNRFSPGLGKASTIILSITIIINLITPFLLLKVNLKYLPIFNSLSAYHAYLIYIISSLILFKNLFSNNTQTIKRYRYRLHIVNLFLLNRVALFSLIIVNIVLIKLVISTTYLSLTIISGLILFLLFFYFDYRDLLVKLKKIVKLITALLVVYLVYLILGQQLIGFYYLNFGTNGDLFNVLLFAIFFLVLKIILYIVMKSKKITFLKNTNVYLKFSPTYIFFVLLSLLMVSKEIPFIELLHIELVFVFFLIYIFDVKHKYFVYLSFEGLRTFLYYLKNIKYNFRIILSENIKSYLLLIVPNLLMCIIYFVLIKEYIFIFLIVGILFLDLFMGIMIALIYPANLLIIDKIQFIQNSKIHKPTSLIMVLIVTFIIQKVIHSLGMLNLLFDMDINRGVQELVLYLLLGFIVFLMVVSVYLVFIWSKNFLSNLFIDDFKLGEREKK